MSVVDLTEDDDIIEMRVNSSDPPDDDIIVTGQTTRPSPDPVVVHASVVTGSHGLHLPGRPSPPPPTLPPPQTNPIHRSRSQPPSRRHMLSRLRRHPYRQTGFQVRNRERTPPLDEAEDLLHLINVEEARRHRGLNARSYYTPFSVIPGLPSSLFVNPRDQERQDLLRAIMLSTQQYHPPETIKVEDIKDKPPSPSPARDGYTRSIKPDLKLMCCKCDTELGEGYDEQQAEQKSETDLLLSKRIFFSRCGHVYCGVCVKNYTSRPHKKGERRPKCVVEGCEGFLTGRSKFTEIYY
uniref:ARAD1D10758p n=1 Tax=Blastobotrys adeninivorans TaxID=409370 RepID=A0A060TDW6_BLAAD